MAACARRLVVGENANNGGNFALDAKIPTKKTNPNSRFEIVDTDVYDQVKADFEKIQSMVNQDKNKFIKFRSSSSGPDNNIGKGTQCIQNQNKKLKDKPE